MIYPASPALLLIKNADYALARSFKMFPSGLKGNKRDIRVYNTRGGSPVSCLLCVGRLLLCSVLLCCHIVWLAQKKAKLMANKIWASCRAAF